MLRNCTFRNCRISQRQDRLQGNEKQNANPEFNFVKGLFAAVLVGITGSAMSLGMEQGRPVADYFEKSGADPLFTTIPVMLLLLSGTLVTTIIWCLYLGIRNRSLGDYSEVRYPRSTGRKLSFSPVQRDCYGSCNLFFTGWERAKWGHLHLLHGVSWWV